MSEMYVSEAPDPDTTCTICYAEFLDPDDLSIHITQVHSVENQPSLKPCKFCPTSLSNLEDYALHIRDEHLPSLRCCKYCNRVFDDFDLYRKHEAKHYTYVTKSHYSCSQCKKLFNNTSELDLHEYKEHSNCNEGVYLNDCLSMLSSFLNIKALKFVQTLGEDVVYTCIKCEMSSSNPHEYLEHLKVEGCRSLVCDGCSSVYRFKKGLHRHLSLHPECFIGGKNRYKQCPECFKMFDLRMWRDHTKHCKAIKCKTCNIVFGSLYDLSKHQTTEHPATVMLQSCKFCHRDFAGPLCLKKHIERAHKHDAHLYKYICTCCNAIFKHPKKLFAHFYSTHKDLEPYTCKICDKKFKIRKKFTIHIKLDHKSIGYIEFDKNYHVFFSDKKSEKQLQPTKNESKEITVKQASVVDFSDETEANIKYEVGTANQMVRNISVSIEENDLEEKPIGLENIQSDFMSATETEANQTEVEVELPKKRKLASKIKGKANKIPRKLKPTKIEMILSDSSDDQTLEELRKRSKRRRKKGVSGWNNKKPKDIKNNKKRFICNICKQYCYTFQNYHNHVALHYKNVTLKCVKCSETFPSKVELNEHYSKVHSSSQLTQTLKNLLEKRKSGISSHSDVSSTERFQRTIKKVPVPKQNGSATLTEIKDKLSVQKFIENFTPEDAPKKNSIEIGCSITLKPCSDPCKDSFVKMTKCNLQHMDFSKAKLSMPVRYRQVIGETHKVTIKEVQFEQKSVPVDLEGQNQDYEDETYFEDDHTDKVDSIPDVAQEVMLEEEPAPKTLYIPHRVVLPKLPKEYKKIRIAHLQAEAPYYKIVKVEDVLNSQGQEENKIEEEPAEKKVDIKLPDGTKLITVNPLAHLLGDTPVEKILEKSKNKYYQPKSKDFEMAIAKAMLRLEKPEAFPRKKRKKAET